MNAIQCKILDKVSLLPDEYIEELIDFLDFLCHKADRKKNLRKSLKKSLSDLGNQKTEIITCDEELNKHFKNLGI